MMAVIEVTDAPALFAEVVPINDSLSKGELAPFPLGNPDRQTAPPLVNSNDIVMAISVPVTDM